MKSKVLLFGMPLFILSGVLFGQVAITGSSHSADEHINQAVYLSGGTGAEVPEGTNTTPDTDNNDPSSSTEAGEDKQRIFQGGGHVTVQDILGISPDNYFINDQPIGIESSTGTYSNPVSVTSPTQPNQNVQNNSLTTVNTSISIYPNPTSDQCNVVTEGEIIFGVVEIIDVTGKTVKKMGNISQTGQGSSITIPVNDLKAGIYLIRFQTNKDIHVKRLQVK